MYLLFRIAIFMAGLFLIFETAMVMRFWLYAKRMDVPLAWMTVAGMRMKNLKLKPLIDAYARARYGELNIALEELVRLQQLGGAVETVVDAMVKVKAGGGSLSFRDAANQHLSRTPAQVLSMLPPHDPPEGPFSGRQRRD